MGFYRSSASKKVYASDDRKSTGFKGMTCIIFIGAVLILASILLIAVKADESDEAAVMRIRQEIREDRFILHAGGFLPGNDGEDMYLSNSVQALDNFRENGTTRFLEMDFLITTDDDIICAHKWKAIYVDGKALKGPVTKAEALSGHYKDTPYTPACIDDVVKLMEDMPETYIVTDVKNDNLSCMKIIADRWPEFKDRFIVQIYHDAEYEEIRSLGFRYIIFTLYDTEEDEHTYEALKAAVDKHLIVGLTVWYKWLNPRKMPVFAEQFDLIKSLGIPLYCHTVDEPEKMREYFDMGFEALYTNVMKPGA
ncbi:MAG: hypothetical protein Q4G47_07435 [Lachnospiraceae bacterium]|nr:hypothetical protein [Lachnospiraceae bacterium]